MEKFNKLKEIVANIEKDAQSFFDKENKAAGKRLRKGLQEIKGLAQELRLEVSAINNKNK